MDFKWQCESDGNCCELFAEFALGYKVCPSLDDGQCNRYATRPKNCRVDTINIEGLDKDEYLVVRCKLIHALKKIKDETGDTKSLHFILEQLAKSEIQ